MQKEAILEVLEDWNCWSKPFKKSFERKSYKDEVAKKATPGEIIFLKGVRRSGKSTILRNYIDSLIDSGVKKEDILFVNLEDPRFAPYLSLDLLEDIKKAYLYYFAPENRPYIFLDEVQNIDNFEKWLLKEYELKNAHLFATGSNSKLLSREIGSALSGRYLGVHVMPLSFKEFLMFKSVMVTSPYELISQKSKIEKMFEEFIKFGGFPQVVLSEDISLKEAELKSYFDSILLRDIVARYKLDSFRSLEQMAVLLLSSVANPMSVTKVSKHLGVSFDLANRYFEYLENTFLIHTLPLFDWSLKKQFSNPKKVYSIDIGLSKRVSFEVGKRKGDLLENIVYLELKRRFEELYYFKTKQGYEVDFVVKQREKITHLVQVSLTLENEKTKKRELRALVKASGGLKYSNKMELWLITMDESSTQKIDGVEIKIVNILEWLLLY